MIHSAKDVSRWFDENNVPFKPVTTLNWAKDFPYRPEFAFRLARTEDALLLNYRVKESAVRGVEAVDNGSVWEDDCVECFIKAPESDVYYNIECNCVGKLLIGCGADRHERKRYEPEILSKVSRQSTLGNEPIGVVNEETEWDLSVVVPFSLLPELHDDGKRTDFLGNVYKCGDKQPTPHFVTLFPIDTPQPDYHRPEFFQPLWE